MSAESTAAQHAPATSGNALPEPPYYAVVFVSLRSDEPGEDSDDHGYRATARRMVELASRSPGFLGVDSARGPDGLGITVSYWRSEADIATWRENTDHALARRQGRQDWYDSFRVHVARVERAYDFRRPRQTP